MADIENNLDTMDDSLWDDSLRDDSLRDDSLRDDSLRDDSHWDDSHWDESLSDTAGHFVHIGGNGNEEESAAPSNAMYASVDPSLKVIGKRAFQRCSEFKSIWIPEGVEIIEEEAFIQSPRLETIYLPSTLKKIEKATFLGCKNLVSVKFKEGLKIIEEFAFCGCSKLNTINLPSTLKKLEKSSFENCFNLMSVQFEEGLEIIGEKAFGGCSNLNTINLPSTLKKLEKGSFTQCCNLRSVEFKEGLVIIGDDAFHMCYQLEIVHFPSTLKTIGKRAFHLCENIESVKFKEGLEIIGEAAFILCTKLNTISLPSTLKQIQEKSFYNCKGLKLIEIREGIGRLGSKAFSGCNNLETVILPSSLIEIGEAFIDCKSLSNIKFPSEILAARKEPIQNNTVLHQLLEYKYTLLFIKSFLKSCPTAISERNTLGQTPLHLCITNQSDFEITRLVYRLWPEALNGRNEIGKTPLDYWEEMGKDPQLGKLFSTAQSLAKIAPSSAFFLKDGKWIPFDTPELLRCQHIMLEIPESDDEILSLVQDSEYSGETLRNYFHKQLYTRELLFGKLLDEFSNLIQFNDKLVIQRAAAVQALCGNEYLSKCLKHHVDLSAFSSSALWYQQEILKLVLRVYHEDQVIDILDSGENELYHSSAINDAKNGQHSLESGTKPVASHRKKSFMALLNWIVNELGVDDFTFEGPVLKPLQSLFNKIYIRRGQTKVSIIGDMTRATLHIKKAVDVVNIIARIKKFFPHIQNFVSPDAVGVEEFMNQVFKMKKVPGTEIIPYRLKANSSQEGKEIPLLYNLNFFDMLPEYHRVGTTEMFVAFELQIGLESEIKSNRDDHVAYERRRILKSQSLLKHYIEYTEDRKHSAEESLLPSSTIGTSQKQNDQDFKIMTAILEGNFSHERLRALDDIELCGEGKHIGKTDRLCLNNKRLNRWMNDGQAFIFDRVSSLDPSLQYCVKSLLIHLNPLYSSQWLRNAGLYVGLFAHVGPYMVNLASRCITNLESKTGNIYIVKPKVNFEMLERISPLPCGCNTVSLICWGKVWQQIEECKYCDKMEWDQLRDEIYKGMKLSLHMYKKLE